MHKPPTGNGTSNHTLTLTDIDMYFSNKHKALSRKRTILKKAELSGESRWRRDKTLWKMDIEIDEIQFLRDDIQAQYGGHNGKE